IASGTVSPSSPSEPPSGKLSVTQYAVKGSVWRVAGVVGLAATAAVVGLRAWSPVQHVVRTEAAAVSLPLVAAPAAHSVATERTPGADGTGQSAGVAPPEVVPGPEAANLAQIEAALPTDPQRALSFADDGNRSFADGALREPREASAIAALAALGKGTQAR